MGLIFERTCALFDPIVRSDPMVADPPRILKGSKKHCYECGQQCQLCQARSQRVCKCCSFSYCIDHDTGCSSNSVSAPDHRYYFAQPDVLGHSALGAILAVEEGYC